jgi:hypothetical protein
MNGPSKRNPARGGCGRDKATGYRFQQMIVPLAVEAWQKAEVAA